MYIDKLAFYMLSKACRRDQFILDVFNLRILQENLKANPTD